MNHIKCLRSGYITLDPLKAIVRLFKYFIKNFDLEKDLKYKLFVFPDFVLTSKPKEVRMGKGKGDPAGWVAPVTPGRILFEVEGVSFDIAKEALRLAAQKLPVKTKFVVRRDYDKNA